MREIEYFFQWSEKIMKLSKMLLALLLVVATSTISFAQCKTCKSCGKEICYPEHKTKKVKVKYYDIECVRICVPGIRWPWQKCKPGCGKVRVVKRLVIKEKEVEKCVCEWKAPKVCESCESGCKKGHCGPVVEHHPVPVHIEHHGPVQVVPGVVAPPVYTKPLPPVTEKLPVVPSLEKK